METKLRHLEDAWSKSNDKQNMTTNPIPPSRKKISGEDSFNNHDATARCIEKQYWYNGKRHAKCTNVV